MDHFSFLSYNRSDIFLKYTFDKKINKFNSFHAYYYLSKPIEEGEVPSHADKINNFEFSGKKKRKKGYRFSFCGAFCEDWLCQGRRTIESPQIKFNDENGESGERASARSGINDARGGRGGGGGGRGRV